MFKRIQSFCVAATCWVGFGIACHADPIPQRYLDVDHAACLSSCGKQGAAESYCKAACDCSIDKMSQSVTLEEYLTMVQAISQKMDPPKPLMDRITQLSLDCAIETKKAMPIGN